MKSVLKKIFKPVLPLYHRLLSFLGAIRYRFPSRELVVIGITGTKGKTTTAEILNAILEAAGHRTALISTLRFKIGSQSQRNLLKMTMPGRFFIQRNLREARNAGCTHAIIEMTSEGAKQSRHRFIDMDALILTNISPEHIESHGSYENYVDAKLSIARALASSKKTRKFLVLNKESAEAEKFLAITGVEKRLYSKETAGRLELKTRLLGDFNLANAAGAGACAEALGISPEAIQRGVASCTEIPGRMELVEAHGGPLPFRVIVDYAHTPDSLEAAYSAYADSRKICVLGGTGGGRDTWKRPRMGAIADAHCAKIVLTNEDPYDEDPVEIVKQVARGITRTPYEIEMDRRVAIRKALAEARSGDTVLITGKGTDPFIMGPKGEKTPWSDAEIAREEMAAEYRRRATSAVI